MCSGDEAMRAMSHLIPALPAFVALSANSPFWRGHKTGHAAYRHRILAATPNFGLPTAFRDWADFENFHNAALKSGMIRHFKDIHWDIRPHPDFGTIEIRAMDAASDLPTLHALVAFARAMVVSMARQVLVDDPGYSRQLAAYAKSLSTRAVAENLTNQLLTPKSA